ncbi:MAG: HAMP domain-containing histidine kinase [Elusimicrobia bacterium]|nr:HAMP domain-containing histidine kinase [Elusimicrobiota bacterium]
MTPALWALRAVNLLLVLAAAWLGTRGKAVTVILPALAAAILCAADAACVFSGRPAEPKARAAASAGFAVADIMLVAWTSQWSGQWAGVPDLGVLIPAILIALEFGPVAGGAAAAAPAAFTVFLVATLGPNPGHAPVLALRGALFALAPVAAGAALGPARARSAAAARATLARLRAAQVGEYLSFALFQLRDYAITISSVSEAIALSPNDAKTGERVERLRKAAGELGVKLSRVLGDQSALTTARPPTAVSVDLTALVNGCVQECREAFAPDGVSVAVRVQNTPPPISSDRRSIELALLAVLQNSLEACAARGSGAVTVLLRSEGPNAEIEITDDGGGVSETDKVTLFEPFLSARRASHGLGLGLSMSRRFLERIGGGLRVKSKGGYTAALLVVPLQRELPKIRLEDSTWAGRRAEHS